MSATASWCEVAPEYSERCRKTAPIDQLERRDQARRAIFHGGRVHRRPSYFTKEEVQQLRWRIALESSRGVTPTSLMPLGGGNTDRIRPRAS
jgi:hypothetical protein